MRARLIPTLGRVEARLKGTDRNWIAIPELEMFDGQPATIEAFGLSFVGIGHDWTVMPAGDAFHEDRRWQRADEAA